MFAFMAQGETSSTCGNKKITYPTGSSFSCKCVPLGKCTWVVVLAGGTVFTGTDLVAPPHPKPPHVTVSGSLQGIATGLQRLWKRRIIVPHGMGKKKIRSRTLRGTPAEIAAALGLELTKKRV